MTNEQKANEICKKHIFDSNHNVNHYIFENEYGETYIKYTFTEDFIKAMKGE